MLCSSCGKELQSGAAFCSACGAKVSGEAPQKVVPPQPPPLPRMQPPQYQAMPAKKSGNRAGILIAIVLGGFALLVIMGIVAAIAVPNLLNAIQRAKQKRTIADMRSISTAVQAYYEETKNYPEADSIQKLSQTLQPKYIAAMPKSDGWEHEFHYVAWSDSSPGYAIGSAGKDGVWEKINLRDYTPANGQSFDSDIVMFSGEFVQQPDMNSAATAYTPPSEPVLRAPGPPLQFAQLNFSFRTPPKPWTQMDAQKVNKSSTLAFMRSQPQVLFFLIAEKIPTGTMDTAVLAEISKGNLKSAANTVDFLEEGNHAVGNKNGIRFISKANIGGNKLLYVHWVYADGPYAYQLITAGESGDEQLIKQEAEKLFSYFDTLSQSGQ
jgi:type II secretory pathway pseudopilin PulG